MTRAAPPRRAPIARSWSRCTAAGLDAAAPTDRFAVHETDPDGVLLRAARPVLDALAAELAGTRLAALLTDADARLTALHVGDPDLRPYLESAGAVAGRTFSEEETGTNAIATVHATGQDLAVEAEEHYFERWRCFTCYGHPVSHPVSGELVGVLDLTGPAGTDTALLAPLVRRAVRDIRAEIAAGATDGQRLLLAAFRREAAARVARPVLALDGDLALANRACRELLGPTDHALVTRLVTETDRGDTTVELSSGPVDVRWRPVPDTRGVLITLRPRPSGAGVPASAAGRTVVVAGEPGTGRTSTVREIVGAGPTTVLEAAELTPTSEHEWVRRAERSLTTPGETTVVEDVHLLLASTASRLRRLLTSPHARVVLTACPVDDVPGDVAALVASCGRRIDLLPLRSRAHELGALATTMLAAVRQDASVRFTAGALEVLAAYRWPGNLRELAAVVEETAARRSAGDIAAADLPARCRQAVPASGAVGDLARVEREAIEVALRACDGNKLRAARRLGISRSTLYARLRALHITP